MSHKIVPGPFKSIIAIFLYMGITVTNVYAQKGDTREKFILKERFISSGGLFFAQPSNASTGSNYAGLSFSPQLNLLRSRSDLSIAFGSQLDIGYKMSSDDGNSKLMASIPAIITFNAGHLAVKDFYSRFGLFVGGGYDFCSIEGESRQGIIWTAGLRTWLLKKSFTLRYSRLMLDESNTAINIFSLQLNLGSYLKQVYRNNKISRFVKPMQ